MKSILYGNSVAASVHKVMDAVVGKPEFGDSWDAGKAIKVSDVPQTYRDVVQQAAGASSTVTGAQLEDALWSGHDAILKEDKSFGIHTSR